VGSNDFFIPGLGLILKPITESYSEHISGTRSLEETVEITKAIRDQLVYKNGRIASLGYIGIFIFYATQKINIFYLPWA